MSRRPDPRADKAAANQQVIKSLLKLPANRLCADCKRNKLPRWASWNLGVFVCIRCSGIHRGMGTHISRVKSVDLDTWTDEQLQSMVKWGNARANKYWEANLAPGHVPSEAKIENFIRTKYESKRWVMEGGIPDPSTLDDDDDDVPLKVVQEKVQSRQQPQSPPPPPKNLPPPKKPVNLFDDDDFVPAPAPKSAAQAPRSSSATQQAPKPVDSLLGLDFFGSAPEPTPRAASATPEIGKQNTGGASRPDLNRSILSLYSAAPPRPAQPVQQQSPVMGAYNQPYQQHSQQSSFGGLDAFGGLNFGGTTSPPPVQAQQSAPKPSPFANLTAGFRKSSSATTQLTNPSTGGFFSSTPSAPKQTAAPVTSSSSGFGDLFDLAPPIPQPAVSNTASSMMNAFNLVPSVSSPKAAPTATPANNASAFSGFDDPWASAAPAPSAKSPPPVTAAPAVSSNDIWGGASSNAWTTSSTPAPAPKPAPVVKDDDDWGNFSSGTTAPTAGGTSSGFDDDLFGNVWK